MVAYMLQKHSVNLRAAIYLQEDINNLSFGFLPSESAKIFEEFVFFFPRKIDKGSIFEEKRKQNYKKIADSERIKLKTEVNINKRIFYGICSINSFA